MTEIEPSKEIVDAALLRVSLEAGRCEDHPQWCPDNYPEKILAAEIARLSRELAEAKERIKAMQAVVVAVKKAICDSSSGMNCEDDTCANNILPPVLARLSAIDSGEESKL